ncbi:L-serine ammonia-lyase, iron-sulfur-dependent, subunit alpha [Hydrogenoanaerobacterium sp.]|uniref:L-serine ammonia-lyase, iron-sulfur-dependent, subunit alpha n=1 Tax=Hydrogenoanaerobacterium sp. TaxID=2953763 RepID=UPI00289FF04A|nr:L-serine ammonia-lyase, iron-sulfur-dependent, subunit alpha [Hydrogenoanaerobacterium sp.]
MDFSSGAALLSMCEQNYCTISQAMLLRETEHMGGSREDVLEKLSASYEIMKQAVHKSLTEQLISMGGLIGGEAQKLQTRRLRTAPVCGQTTAKAIAYAMGVLEVNASMGLIVAAPTAGSSGVIPGVFLAVQEEFGFTDEQMVDALLNTGAVGYLFTRNATIAGAEGGCQAEVGTASAMAASAVTQLMGGSPEQCLSAAAMAISNLLGLVCDPVAGLVESPCQTRNAIGASNALISAEISLSGIRNLIPFDEMVEAMYRVGRSLPFELRETALGGCAGTPTGCTLCKRILGT